MSLKNIEIDRIYETNINDKQVNSNRMKKYILGTIMVGYIASNFLGDLYNNFSKALGIQKIIDDLNGFIENDTDFPVVPELSGVSDDAEVLKISFVNHNAIPNNGFGDATMLSRNNYNLLMDTLKEPCRASLKKFLEDNNYKKFDIYISHIHSDHIGNLFFCVDNYDVSKVYLPNLGSFDEIEKKLQAKGVEVIRLEKGDTFNIGDENCTAEVIYGPDKTKGISVNDRSLVTIIKVKTNTGDVKFFTAGDIEEPTAKKILQQGIDVSADIMKGDHHGGGDSEDLIRAVGADNYVYNYCKPDDGWINNQKNTADILGNVYSVYYNGGVTFSIKGSGEIVPQVERNYENYQFEIKDEDGNTAYTVTYQLNKRSSHVLTEHMEKVARYKKQRESTTSQNKKRYFEAPMNDFSEETKRIIKKYQSTITEDNKDDIIKEYGSLANYFKTMGGVFTKYAGKKARPITVGDFQEYSEFVFGVWAILGLDYVGSTKYVEWYDKNNRFFSNHNTSWTDKAIDEILETGNLGLLNCNAGIDQLIKGTVLTNGNPIAAKCPNGTIIRSEDDLQVGDIILYTGHVAMVGEIHKDSNGNRKIILYDSGSRFVMSGRYKYELHDSTYDKYKGKKIKFVRPPFRLIQSSEISEYETSDTDYEITNTDSSTDTTQNSENKNILEIMYDTIGKELDKFIKNYNSKEEEDKKETEKKEEKEEDKKETEKKEEKEEEETEEIENETEEKNEGEFTIDLPEGFGKVKTFEAWDYKNGIMGNEWNPSNQRKLWEAADGLNSYDPDGFGIINGSYVVAVTTTFGDVGDFIKVKLKGGIVIPCIIGDIKSQGDKDCNKYGHLNGQCVLEFMGKTSKWYQSEWYHKGVGDPTMIYRPEWYNKAVDSITNTGVSYFNNPEYINSVNEKSAEREDIAENIAKKKETENTEEKSVLKLIKELFADERE